MSENKRVTLPFLTKILKPVMDLIHKKADKSELLPFPKTNITHNELITNEKGEIIWSKRTHYSEEAWVNVITLSNYSFSGFAPLFDTSVQDCPFTAGDKVQVTFFGEKYEVTVYESPDGIRDCIGNFSIFTGLEEHNTGEPFFGFNDGNGYIFLTNILGTSDLIIDVLNKEFSPLEEGYIPDTIARKTEIPVVDATLTLPNAAAEAKATGDAINNINMEMVTPKDGFALRDKNSKYIYIVNMIDGNLVTSIGTKYIAVFAPPDKTEYMHSGYFDPTGMAVMAICYDNTMKDITNEIYTIGYLVEGATFAEIYYKEAGVVHTCTTPITVSAFNPDIVLQDFTYTSNGDGTYQLTGWKGTYNGVASTEIIIPNYNCIYV